MNKDEKKIVFGLVFLLILAGVGGYAVQKKEEKQTQTLKDQLVFLDLNPADVTQIKFCPKDTDCVTLSRRPKDEHQFDYIDDHAFRDAEWMVDHGWVVHVSSDQTLLASPGSMDTFFEGMRSAHIEKKDALTDENKKQYQLDQPELTLTIKSKDQSEQQLSLGTTNPSETFRYALKDQQQTWWLIEKNLDTYLQTQWEDWAEKNWLRVSQDQMQKMTLRTQGELFTLQKKEDQWIFDQQSKAGVDADHLTKWFRSLNTSQAAKWIPAPEDNLQWRAAYGFDQPLMKIDMSYGQDSERPSVSWQLSKDPNKANQYYVKRDDQPWIYALKPGDAKNLLVQKIDWVDRTLLTNSLQEYQSLTWQGTSSGKAAQTQGDWTLTEPEPDLLSMTHLESLYEALVNKQDKRLISTDVPMPKNKGLTLTWASEQGQQTLHLFKKDDTHFIWRKEPSALLLASDQALTTLIEGHLNALREKNLFSGKSENLTSITYKSDQGQWTIKQTQPDQWQWGQPAENRSDQEAYEAFVLVTEANLQNLTTLKADSTADGTHSMTFTTADNQTTTWQWNPDQTPDWTLYNPTRKVKGTLKAEKAKTWAKFLIRE